MTRRDNGERERDRSPIVGKALTHVRTFELTAYSRSTVRANGRITERTNERRDGSRVQTDRALNRLRFGYENDRSASNSSDPIVFKIPELSTLVFYGAAIGHVPDTPH